MASEAITPAQNHWVSGLFPLSGILNTKKHDISETLSVVIFRLGKGHTLIVHK
jgi:hypothetical protein